MPAASIAALEVENEGGTFIYSFDMKPPRNDGIDEVNVDASTGSPVGPVQYEASASERTEAAAEKKAAA